MQTYQNGKHTFRYTTDPISIPKNATATMLELLDAWQREFPLEQNYVSKTFGVPCLTVRFDGIITETGEFVSYEIQPAGAGIGYAGLVNESFREIRDRFKAEKWPPFKLVQNEALVLDDELWLERISLAEALAGDDLLQFRHPLKTLDIPTRQRIVARSVKPVRHILSKEYGVALGWWNTVTYDSTYDNLPWEQGFALKPVVGWGSYDIMIWHPVGRPGGSATRSQILRAFQKHGTMYLQPFIPPMKKEIDGITYNAIARPFFGYDPTLKQWVPWGGTWNGRPSPTLRIHGSSDAIAGPLVLES
jgi:hypothetical protein